MEKLRPELQKLILWVCAYSNLIALVIAGGYTLVRSGDSGVRRTAVQAFIIHAIFLAVNAFLSLLYYILVSLLEVNYYDINSSLTTLVSIARIIVFAVFAVLALVGAKKSSEN